ncbi:hypothetical protein CCZ01_00135 [Helicobacter monodelphidis]|uniref:hypothetical protein n=1 Tax=Helicobacter sp. 15-1451 TaxID=2004995 RepID=UPI000DCECEB6|nr:hypothetical protein [Helicobacter sp. 15-1451]RAX59192.1 hypothetical protein CCZ01_00135 [Helicobacter sp. 15-1451]
MLKYSFIFLMIVSIAYSKSQEISPLPLPTMEMINTNPELCDTRCLEKLLKEEQIFSFLARFTQYAKESRLLSAFSKAMDQHGFGKAYPNPNSDAQMKLAIIFPRKQIGSYSTTTINTILSYLTTQSNSFYFEVFDLPNESLESLSATLGNIEGRHFGGTIAILTSNSLPSIPKLSPKIPLYIANIHKEQLKTAQVSPQIIFGGISYQEQVAKLKHFTDSQLNTAMYTDISNTGKRIAASVKAEGLNVVFQEDFSLKQAAKFSRSIQSKAKILRNSNLFLNTAINDTAFILSQLTYSRIRPAVILTTQLGFNYALFDLTQANARRSLYVSSVTGEQRTPEMNEYAALLDADVHYDWIHYSTAIGVEYFYQKLFGKERDWFSEDIKDNQVRYNIKVYRVTSNLFEPVD